MFRLSLLIALIATGAIAYRKPQAQTGEDRSVVWTGEGKHVLQTANQVGRNVVNKLQFAKPFSSYPQVLVSNFLLDFQDSVPSGYQIDVVSMSVSEFTVKYTALTARQVYSVFINYLAVDDSKVQVGYVYSDQLGALSSGEGDRKISLKLGYKWDVAPSKVVGTQFLIGARFTKPNWSVLTNFRDVTVDNAILDVSVWGKTTLDYLRIGYIVGDPSALWVSDTANFKGNLDSIASAVGGIPSAFISGTRSSIYGLTGYDVDAGINFRLSAGEYAQPDGRDQATVKLSTWAGSKVYGANWRAAIYKPDPDFIIWDPKCAELFSECNYQGNTILICDREDSFPKKGWKGPVKSFHLPPNKTLKLYDQENLGGKVVTFTESQKCVENLSFSFLQRAQLID